MTFPIARLGRVFKRYTNVPDPTGPKPLLGTAKLLEERYYKIDQSISYMHQYLLLCSNPYIHTKVVQELHKKDNSIEAWNSLKGIN
jgi:hypothetical protein